MTRRSGGAIRIGIGGWTYEPWRGAFYPVGLPHKRELAHAASRLTSIEINGTFYGSQRPESFVKWREETPDGFVFAVKAPRYATNRRILAEGAASIERFFTGGLLELKDKLGPVNWQFAATKTFDPVDFESFLKLLPKDAEGRRLRHAVEVRHPSFRDPVFVDLARSYGVAIVMAGDSNYVQIADAPAPFVYARIMGTQEGEALGYPAGALDLWATRAKELAAGRMPDGIETVSPPPSGEAQPRDVYLYVISGHKALNPAAAMALIERLG